MKIRISGNSVRLRLSQSEVLHFVSQGLVSDECHFGNEKLTYQIAQYNGNEIVASLTGQTISVQVPENLAAHWDTDTRVGFDGRMANGLFILIEKDFQCLKPRPNEDESDLFPNPQAECWDHD